jgi:hypothetical protein
MPKPIPSLRTLTQEADEEKAQEVAEQARLDRLYAEEMALSMYLEDDDDFLDEPSFGDDFDPFEDDDFDASFGDRGEVLQ